MGAGGDLRRDFMPCVGGGRAGRWDETVFLFQGARLRRRRSVARDEVSRGLRDVGGREIVE